MSEVLWLSVGGACNSNCVVCLERNVPEIGAEEVRAAAEKAHPAVLVLTGPGEPTMRKDLARLVHAARRGGASHVAMVTNGRALSYPRIAQKIASLCLSHIFVSILHVDPAEHDRLAHVPGAHEQSIAGLLNIITQTRGTDTHVLLRSVPHPDLLESLEGEPLSFWTLGKAVSLAPPLFAPSAFAGVGLLLVFLPRIAPLPAAEGTEALRHRLTAP